MPIPTDRRNNRQPPLEFGEKYEEDFEMLRTERDNLKKSGDTIAEQNEELKRKIEELSRKANRPPQPPIQNGAGVMLLLIAIVMLGRLGLYAFAEDWGHKAHIEGLISSAVFGGAALVILFAWATAEWRAAKWLMIPKAVTVTVAMVISASSLSGGALLEGTMDSPANHPLVVAAGVTVVLLFAASPFWIWTLRGVMRLLNDPIGTIKGFWEDKDE